MSELEQVKIDGWKKEFGKIFQCKISDKTYVYRTLHRDEFESLQKDLSAIEGYNQGLMTPEIASKLEDGMVQLCVLYPENNDVAKMEAGTPAILATYISDASGAKVDEEPVQL